jgi:hypothetical protein
MPHKTAALGVAQDGVVTQREHGGHPMSLAAQAAVSDGKHRTMNAVQVPAFQANLPAPPADADGIELSERDDAVLPGGNPRNQGVSTGVAEFCTHVGA